MPCWVDVMVETDEQREKVMAFYSALYGWTWDVGDETMGYYSIASHESSAVMGLIQGPGGQGAMITYFATGDIDASVARAAQLGGNVLMGPIAIREIGTTAIVLDPTGAVHGLWQPNSFAGFGVVYEVAAPGWFDHSSNDPDVAVKYYEALLGQSVLEPSPGMKVLSAGEQWFASFSLNQIPERWAGQWNALYIVEKLADMRKKVCSLGATIVLEEMPVPGSAISVFIEPVMNTVVTVMGAGSHDEVK